MRIAVVSCWAYRDCWKPFSELLKRFWPDCPYRTVLITDTMEQPMGGFFNGAYIAGKDKNWCECVSGFASQSDEPILLFLDDFFLSGKVDQSVVSECLKQFEALKAGCFRLYPCPGPDDDNRMSIAAPYRISTMPAIWKPAFLRQIAEKFDNPWDFETAGTELSRSVQEEIYGWKRETTPWPIEILCTGITRGKWTQGAKELFEREKIAVDWSLRACWA